MKRDTLTDMERANLDFTFGVTISYLIPGFTALRGFPFVLGDLQTWEHATFGGSSVAGFLSSTLAALAVGLTLSAFRWLLVDWIHHHTGIKPGREDFAGLKDSTEAFQLLIRAHYHYYKFYGNMMMALLYCFANGGWKSGWLSIGYLLVAALFFLGSRDCLRKYYQRTGSLLGPIATLFS